MRRVDPADPATDELRLGDWLAAHGQDDRARRALWDLFSVSSLNVPGDDASLALAAVVVQTGLLGDAGAADVGVPALSLGELHGAAAARLLAGLGATVRLNTKVAAIDAPNQAGGAGRVRRAPGRRGADDTDTEDLPADAVVLAVPHEAAAKLIPAGALPAEAVDGWAGLGAAPDRERARDLRPQGHGRAVRGRGGLAGAVGVRPHADLRDARSRRRRPVPGDLAVGGRRVRGRPGGGPARAVRAGAGRTVPGRAHART